MENPDKFAKIPGLYAYQSLAAMHGRRLCLHADGHAEHAFWQDLGGGWFIDSRGVYDLDGDVMRLNLEPVWLFDPPEQQQEPEALMLYVRFLGKRVFLVREEYLLEFERRGNQRTIALYRRIGGSNEVTRFLADVGKWELT